jgi:hypothetical protein
MYPITALAVLLAGLTPLALGAEAVVLHEPGMPVRGMASAAPVVRQILAGAGIHSRLVSARELADPAMLDAATIDLVVLPTGQSFPVAARDNLVRFLRAGGDLLQLGGYAFDNLLWEQDGRWYDQAAFVRQYPDRRAEAAPLFRPMNTARGKPRNEMKLEPEQLGMFDACFPLKRACRLATAGDQLVVRRGVELRRALLGWGASGIVGDFENNGIDFLRAKLATNARWVPLLETFDRYGRPRGAAAALLLNQRGFYAGSNWAYFGVENVDLCADPTGPAALAVQDAARFLTRGVCLGELVLDKRLLRAGERLTATAVVRNTGRREQSLRLALAVGPADQGDLPPVAQRELRVPAGQAERVQLELTPAVDGIHLGQVRVTLSAGGEPIDCLATGYVVDRPEVIRSGADLRFADNYFTRAGRPSFLFGTDETAYVYLTPNENPLTWSRDLLAARDVGMNLYENLQYSRPGHVMQDADWRNVRAMAQLTQQYNLVFMPGMLVVHNVAVGQRAIEEESRQCAGYARLLADAPGVLHYLNGDYVYRPDLADAEIQRLWRQWYAAEHRTPVDERRTIPTKLGPGWDDPAAMDLVRFSHWMTERWNRAHLAAVRAEDRQHPLTSEYYQAPAPGIHLRRTMAGHDVANTNLFLPVEAQATALRWNDLRERGKGLSVGEYGMQAHPAWRKEGGPSRDYAMPTTDAEQSRLFTAVAHYGLGLGAAKIQNWCLRDAQHRSIHPWGIFYAEHRVPKDVAYVHRNLSLVWRHFRPRYVAPSLAVCIPLGLGQGSQKQLECAVAYRAFSTLFELHHDFNVYDDEHLEGLGPATKALIYPAPFTVRDSAYQRLRAWVRAGGTLLVTGDFSYDEQRKRTRAERLAELAGVKFVGENYANVARAAGKSVRVAFHLPGVATLPLTPCVRLKAAGAEVLGAGPAGEPVVVRHRVGQGVVYYVADPLELSLDPVAAEARRRLYAAVLQRVPLTPLAVEPNVAWLQVFAQPTARGMVHVLMNARKGTATARATLATTAGRVTVGLRDGWPALAAATTDGRLVATFGDGRVEAQGSVVVDGAGQKALLALDGRDLRQSAAVLVAPWEPGSVTLPGRAGQVAIVGDFRDGRWTAFEQVPLTSETQPLTIDADRASCLLLVCRPADAARWQQQLTAAMLHPERIEGY